MTFHRIINTLSLVQVIKKQQSMKSSIKIAFNYKLSRTILIILHWIVQNKKILSQFDSHIICLHGNGGEIPDEYNFIFISIVILFYHNFYWFLWKTRQITFFHLLFFCFVFHHHFICRSQHSVRNYISFSLPCFIQMILFNQIMKIENHH